MTCRYRNGEKTWKNLFARLISEEDAIVEGFRLAFLLDLNLRNVQSSAGERFSGGRESSGEGKEIGIIWEPVLGKKGCLREETGGSDGGGGGGGGIG